MTRRPILDLYDVMVLLVAAAVSLLAWFQTPMDLRSASTVLGATAFCLLAWRLVSSWPELSVLSHAVMLVLVTELLSAAIAQAGLVHMSSPTHPLPPNPWIWLVLVNRVAAIVLAIWWRTWLGRRVSPFKGV